MYIFYWMWINFFKIFVVYSKCVCDLFVFVLCFEYLFCVMWVRLLCCFDNVDVKWIENIMMLYWVGVLL